MQRILKGSRAMIFHSHLPVILWTEALTTMTYIKNRSPNPFTIHKSTVTIFSAWNYCTQLTINHLSIFGNTHYVPNESKLPPRLTTKAWTGYLVRYERQQLYCT